MLGGKHDGQPPLSGLAEFVAPVIQLPAHGLVLRDVLVTPWETLRRRTRASKSAQVAVKDEDQMDPEPDTQQSEPAVQQTSDRSKHISGGVKPEPLDDDMIMLNRTVSTVSVFSVVRACLCSKAMIMMQTESVKEEITSDGPLTPEKYTIYEEFQHLKDEEIKQTIAALSNVSDLILVRYSRPCTAQTLLS